jgi:hypothetical protein
LSIILLFILFLLVPSFRLIFTGSVPPPDDALHPL